MTHFFGLLSAVGISLRKSSGVEFRCADLILNLGLVYSSASEVPVLRGQPGFGVQSSSRGLRMQAPADILSPQNCKHPVPRLVWWGGGGGVGMFTLRRNLRPISKSTPSSHKVFSCARKCPVKVQFHMLSQQSCHSIIWHLLLALTCSTLSPSLNLVVWQDNINGRFVN